MILAWTVVSCLALSVSWYSAKGIYEPDRSARWKLLALETARNFWGYLSLAVSGGTGQAHLGLMWRLRNLSCFIVPADVLHAILHFCNAECLHVGSHYTVSATFTPSSPNSIWSVHAKNNIKIHVYERGGRQREENLLTKRLMTILITFYCKPGSSLFKELHSWLWEVGEKVPNLRRLSNTYIKIFSAMPVKRQMGGFWVFQAPVFSVAWAKADERV